MSVNQIERAFRAWPILIAIAKSRDTISYGKLASNLGIHHRTVSYVLGVIQDYCLEEGFPPLTILIVNSSGRPGTGFIAFDLSRFNEGLESVWDYNWNQIENPFGFSAAGESYETLVKTLTHAPEESEAVYLKVKSRGIKQILFRSALLSAYQNKCAFTALSFTEALEACHIIPWSQATDAQRLDVRNGILLNRLHHRLFDCGYVTISVNHEIIFSDPNEEEGEYGEFDRLVSSGLHGNKMFLPFRLKHRPLPEYISKHHEIAEWEV